MPEPTNWYDSASAALRKFFEFAGGKDLPGAPNAPTRNPFGGGGIAPKPDGGFDWGKLFSFGSSDDEAKKLHAQELARINREISRARAFGTPAEIKALTDTRQRTLEEGAPAWSARKIRERTAIGKVMTPGR